MRACKECGKLFVPKGREQYCSDTHYRPCPVCGTPVVAKYLSDPPKRCDACRHMRSKSTTIERTIQPKTLFSAAIEKSNQEVPIHTEPEIAAPNSDEWMEEVQIEENQPTIDSTAFCEKVTGTVMFYIGNQYKNSFQKGHKYLIKVERSDYVYDVSSVEDVTTGEACDIIIPVASQISFYQKFANVKVPAEAM